MEKIHAYWKKVILMTEDVNTEIIVLMVSMGSIFMYLIDPNFLAEKLQCLSDTTSYMLPMLFQLEKWHRSDSREFGLKFQNLNHRIFRFLAEIQFNSVEFYAFLCESIFQNNTVWAIGLGINS
jgi:hypothetical protein